MMRFKFTLLFLIFVLAAQAQHDSLAIAGFVKKNKQVRGAFYFGWGYNKDYYSKSDIHVSGNTSKGPVDFTLYDMKATDRPLINEVFREDLTVPQFGARVGWWMPNGIWGVELNYDHPKYIVTDYQTVRLKGNIFGKQYDVDTLIDPVDFMHLEHTDGANFLVGNIMYRKKFFSRPNFRVFGMAKLGAGIVIPRSNVHLFGVHLDNRFHIAGQVASFETGLHIDIFRHFYIEPTVKGAFANYGNALAVEDAFISHHFWAGMIELHVGIQFPMGRSKPEFWDFLRKK
jgi:hypothetical protein